MSMKDELTNLCKRLSTNYNEWDYISEAFKNKEYKFCTKFVDPLWSYSPDSVLAQPVAGVYVNSIQRLHKRIFGHSTYWTDSTRLDKYYKEISVAGIRLYDIENDAAEDSIKYFLNKGIELINKTYSFSSEEDLLSSIPEKIEGNDGVMYCLVRAYLGDMDYVGAYLEDKIKTVRPKKYDKVRKIIMHFE